MGEMASLSLPARPEFVSVARLTLAGLASRLGFDVDTVEDLRVAVAEAVTMLVQAEQPAGQVELQATWDEAALEIAVCREGGAVEVDRDEAAVAILVMEAMVDTATLEQSAAGRTIIRLRKARTQA